MSKLENTLKDIDLLHSQDPTKVLVNGEEKAAELIYAENMTPFLSPQFEHNNRKTSYN